MIWKTRRVDTPTPQVTGRNGGGWAALLGLHQQVVRPVEPLVIKAGVIGRPHAGKTVLFRGLYRGTVQDNLPSQLQIDVDSPLATAKMIKETRATEAGLHVRGLPPTLQRERIEFHLFEGDAKRATYFFNEVIGQVLVNTVPDSPKEQKEVYAEYVVDLSDCDVLWLVVPCPPHEATQHDLARYEDDLRLLGSYWREAIRLRKTARPCNTAIVMTKLDTLFSSEDEAKAQLSDDRVIELIRPLVSMTLGSERTANAAIFMVSPFGWQTAHVKPSEDDGDGDCAASERRGLDDAGTIEHGELEWILKPGVSPRPYGLTKLVVWSLLCGMLYQDVEIEDGQEHPLRRVCNLLHSDLRSLGGWCVPIKGTLVSG